MNTNNTLQGGWTSPGTTYIGDPPMPWLPITPYPSIPYPYQPTKMVKRTTKTVEKWGPQGEYLGREVITEEVEDVVVLDYVWTVTYSPTVPNQPNPNFTNCVSYSNNIN